MIQQESSRRARSKLRRGNGFELGHIEQPQEGQTRATTPPRLRPQSRTPVGQSSEIGSPSNAAVILTTTNIAPDFRTRESSHIIFTNPLSSGLVEGLTRSIFKMTTCRQPYCWTRVLLKVRYTFIAFYTKSQLFVSSPSRGRDVGLVHASASACAAAAALENSSTAGIYTSGRTHAACRPGGKERNKLVGHARANVPNAALFSTIAKLQILGKHQRGRGRIQSRIGTYSDSFLELQEAHHPRVSIHKLTITRLHNTRDIRNGQRSKLPVYGGHYK